MSMALTFSLPMAEAIHDFFLEGRTLCSLRAQLVAAYGSASHRWSRPASRSKLYSSIPSYSLSCPASRRLVDSYRRW